MSILDLGDVIYICPSASTLKVWDENKSGMVGSM